MIGSFFFLLEAVLLVPVTHAYTLMYRTGIKYRTAHREYLVFGKFKALCSDTAISLVGKHREQVQFINAVVFILNGKAGYQLIILKRSVENITPLR